MNSYIERISLCSLIIFIFIIYHFETVNSNPIVFASNSFLNYNTENFTDKEENINTRYSEIDNINTAKNSIELNSTNSSDNTVEEKETNLLIDTKEIIVLSNNLAFNENLLIPSDKIEPGPNHNNQSEENNIELQKSNAAIAIESPTIEITTEKESDVVNKLAEMSAQFAKPPLPPGGDGGDPFAVPIDNTIGFLILLGVSLIIGVMRLRKLKSLSNII